MNRDDVVEAAVVYLSECIHPGGAKPAKIRRYLTGTLIPALASLSKAQPDTRRAHLDNVRSNMTQGDHNTVPAQPEEGLVGELREHARQSERFGEESTASEDAMSRAADEIERLTALSRNHYGSLERAGFDYVIPQGSTYGEWRDHVRRTPLYQRGDTVLVWVNEGDLNPIRALKEDSK